METTVTYIIDNLIFTENNMIAIGLYTSKLIEMLKLLYDEKNYCSLFNVQNPTYSKKKICYETSNIRKFK